MRVIPAIDLKGGQCVRLQKGDYNTVHKVAEDAVETARLFQSAGATLIHMVDLDAAKDGTHANYDVVARVIRETGARVGWAAASAPCRTSKMCWVSACGA